MLVGLRTSEWTEETVTAKSATFYLEGVPAGTALLGTTGKVVSTSDSVTVDWGDGTTDTIPYMYNMQIPSHTYAAEGDYTIVIIGTTLTEVRAVSDSYYPIFTTRKGYGLSYLKRAVLEGVTSIGSYCFYECTDLTSVTIGDGVTSIGDSSFGACTGLTSVTIPDSVTSMGDGCFAGTGLTNVTIPDSVTSMGDSCFYECTDLTSVTIGDSVTSIGSHCFYNCTDLTSVTIGDSVTSIGFGCFDVCLGLSSLTCKATVPPTFGGDAFTFVSTSIPVYVPSASIAAYQAASGWSDFTNYQPL